MISRNFRTSLMLGVASVGAAAGLIAASPAMAQDAPQESARRESPTINPGDIIVTARRTEERLQDVPISITVFNQEQLNNRNVVSAADLATSTPSLSANTNFGSQNSSFAIRGFVQDLGTAPSVGVYFADVVAPRGASNGLPSGDGAGPGAFFDLQNVQVLKGPQGTLFGRNTTGGAVLLVPNRPTDTFEGYVSGSIGNYDMRRVQAVLNVPLSDTFKVRLGVDRMKRDGYLHNNSGVGPKDFNDVDYVAARLSVIADLTPDLENYMIATYSRSDTHGDAQKLIAADPAYSLGHFASEQLTPGSPNYQGSGFYDFAQDLQDPRSLLTVWQIINTTTWHASDTLTIKNVASYGQLTDTFRNPIFGTAFETPAIAQIGIPSYRFGFASSQPLPGRHTADESTFTEEFQIQGRSSNDKLNWQTGAYLEAVEPLSLVGSKSPVIQSCANSAALAASQCYDVLSFLSTLAGGSSAPAGAINTTAGRTSFHNVGLYAQATYKFTDQFKLTGGFRYTWDRENNTSVQTTTITGFPFSLPTFQPLPAGPIFTSCTYPDAPVQDPSAENGCRRDLKQKSSAPTWLIDFDYTPTQDILVYAKYARGYRAGGIAPNVTASFATFDPEKVDAFEIGTKTSWHGSMPGNFNVAGFYNKFADQQLQVGFNANPCQSTDAAGNCISAPVSPTAAPVNAGKSRIWGIEVDASISPFQGLLLQAGYTYLNTKLTSAKTFSLDPGSPYVLSGTYLVGDPLALSPKNKVTISGTYTLPLPDSVGKVSFGLTYTHTDKMLANTGNRFYAGCNGTANQNMPNCQPGAVSDPATVAYIQSLTFLQPTDLLNVNVNWDNIAGTPIDAGFFASNVTNEKYYSFFPGLSTGTGFETASVGAPRMYGFTLKYHFGG
ncbi:iron complex outermembrane receptor protein [Novosphingobium sp. PhB165]|uniref:TonB-dependent receptor n=1 Tax=Novosphingobium sp. PhB165 TaxID=2485105 RepID=UPI0010D08BB8|nr:TonB-dependent receptor [Novosphingobium sp. PhB165]TCM19546.1 iron complex outermembrane receptor protein [Novosphingobium sp. PhB165]